MTTQSAMKYHSVIPMLFVDNSESTNMVATKIFHIDWQMVAQLPSDQPDITHEQVTAQAQITVARIQFLLESMLTHSVWLTPEQYVESATLLDLMDNTVTTTPDLFEGVLAAALFMKFNSVAMECCRITSVTIQADSDLSYEFTSDKSVGDLTWIMPGVEYITQFPVWEKPWWLRNDTMLHDEPVPDCETQEQLLQIVKDHEPSGQDSVWDAIDQHIMKNRSHDSEKTTTGDVIHVNFKKTTQE